MAQVYNKDEFSAKRSALLRSLKGSVFVYPTDTIYGIGCNALDDALVHRVRDIKKRHSLPFSVIAPSKEWIREHCLVDERGEEWLARLPGPYTLVLRLKDGHPLPDSVNMGLGTVGVRIPDNWFSDVVRQLNVPIVTTSANLTGDDHMTALEDLHPAIRKSVDLIIFDGELHGRPSTLVRLDTESVELKER